MNWPNHKQLNDRSCEAVNSAEETLRILTKLPAPDGLSARVQASLRTVPTRSRLFRFGDVFGPFGWMHSSALRTAAAAAIVIAVAGTGWQIYSHVQTSPGMQGVSVPVRVSPATGGESGFSTSGAIAKPNPLKAPVITHQVMPKTAQTSQQTQQAEKKPVRKQPRPASVDQR